MAGFWRKVGDFFKRIFTPKNWKRWSLLSLITAGTVAGITCGSYYYISKNVNRSVEYGGGAEVLVKINKDDKSKPAEAFTKSVAHSLENRLTGGTSMTGTMATVEGTDRIRITKNGNMSDEGFKALESLIKTKPALVLTDENMHPLFYNNVFVQDIDSIDYDNIAKYAPPLLPDGASADFNPSFGRYSVSVKLNGSEAEAQWSKATEYLAKTGKSVLMWLNLDQLYKIALEDKTGWEKSKHNLYNFVWVNETPPSYQSQQKSIMKSHSVNAKNYLISVAGVREALHGSSFSINGNFTENEAKTLAENINFGSSKYSFETLLSTYVKPDKLSNSFEKALIAGLVAFCVIAAFMLVNYGLLGALSTISIALYIFLTLLMFTVLRGEYSPVTIAALVIGIGISVDANIITFERLKNEIYSGEKLKKAFKNANRMSLSSIVDANLTTLIVSFILFYFGIRTVKSFSISLVLSVIFTLFVMLLYTRMMATLLINTGAFDNHLGWLGIRTKKINNLNMNAKYRKFDYVKNTRWFALGSLLFILIGLAVYITFAIMGHSAWAGFNRSIDFQGGTKIYIKGQGTGDDAFLPLDVKDSIIQYFHNPKVAEKWGIVDIDKYIKVTSSNYKNTGVLNYVIMIETPQDLTSKSEIITSMLKDNFTNIEVIPYGMSTVEAKGLVKNALLSVLASFIGIILYTLVRLKWTYSIAAIVGLIHDALMTIAFIAITRLQLSPIIVAAVLSIVAFSINDTIVVFDRIRETIRNEHSSRDFLDAQTIKSIANKAVVDTIKRSIFTSITTIATVLVLLAFGNATDFSFNIIMIFGLAVGSYSSIFICTWLWVKLETKRQLKIKKHIDTKYWVMPGPDEQTFPGINDFIA